VPLVKKAAIYARISEDRAGAGLGVARQEKDCKALCKRLGWKVAQTYTDNDTSAYSGKPRPAWGRLVEDIEAGRIEAVAVWHVDRLTRSPVELEAVIDLADRTGLKLATVTGEIDLATPTGRMVARILGATARQEVEHKAERQKRARRQNAEAGKPGGGGTRPYGYEADYVTVVDSEAAIVRDCAARVLAGESLSSVCRDLEARDVRTTRGNHWKPSQLRRLLASARISGRREHTPRSVKDKGTRPLLGEIVADAVWPAIISEADSDKIRALLADPKRLKYSPATGRKYLLSGILRCGLCGGKLAGRPREGVPRYVCSNLPGNGTCGKIATNAERTDTLIRDMLLKRLETADFRDRLYERAEVDPGLRAAVLTDERRLEELAEEWADGGLTRGEWKAARARIEARLEDNRAELARVAETTPLDGLAGSYEDLLTVWESMNVSQRRAVVAACLERVDVDRASKLPWDPDRFKPVWRV
jgi:site-specific DNA recombinase